MSDDRLILHIRSREGQSRDREVWATVLDTLHATLREDRQWWFFWKYSAPVFSHEIIVESGMAWLAVTAPADVIDTIKTTINHTYGNAVDVSIARDPFRRGIVYTYCQARLRDHHLIPLQIHRSGESDAQSDILSILRTPEGSDQRFFQVVYTPCADRTWRDTRAIEILSSDYPSFVRGFLLSRYSLPIVWIVRACLWALQMVFRMLRVLIGGTSRNKKQTQSSARETVSLHPDILAKSQEHGFVVSMRWGTTDPGTARVITNMLTHRLTAHSGANTLTIDLPREDEEGIIYGRTITSPMILTARELTEITHVPHDPTTTPGLDWIPAPRAPHVLAGLPTLQTHPDITPIGTVLIHGREETFGVLPQDRARHVYIVGKTGMGKSTLIENMLYEDIAQGRGVALIDPHGDLVDGILAHIPKNRTNDVVIFDPSDRSFPIAFNMLENVRPELRPVVASGIIGVFKKIFGNSWGPRLEYVLRNTILTLLHIPDTTLLHISLLLTTRSYREKIVARLDDPVLIKFWRDEFETLDKRQMTETISPILNKIGQFLSSSLIRNIIAQPHNTFSLRWVMDNKKIFIANLSKGRIGEDASALLGAMMITKFQIDAMSRADIPESERTECMLYIDEVHNFATESFATILSESRKYHLHLVMANQYLEQMSDDVRKAIFGNVGTCIAFQVGPIDMRLLSAFMDDHEVSTHDLTHLGRYEIFVKLLVEGMPFRAFRGTTIAPLSMRLPADTQEREILTRVSRDRYTRPVAFVEAKIRELGERIAEDERLFREEGERRRASRGQIG